MTDSGLQSREARQSAGRLCRAFAWYRSGRGAAVLAGLFVLNLVALGIVGWARREDTPAWRLTAPARLLIVEPHADDAAIEAGGLAIQNAELGGSTLIVTVTQPIDSATAAARVSESLHAWSLVTPTPAIRALHLPSRRPWPDEEIAQARDSLTAVLREFAPEIVVLPLDEGGHDEHDYVNRIGAEAARTAAPGARVLQASIYNPYYDPAAAPMKFVHLLVRFAPGVPYQDPTYGLPRGGLSPLAMSAEELALKRRMLEAYPSQADVIPLSQFGFPDLYQSGQGRPDGMIGVAGKYLTPWGIATLLSVLASFGYLGSVTVGRVGSTRAGGASAVIGLAAIGMLGVSGRGRLVIEDLLYVVCLLVGVAAGAAAAELCRGVREARTR